MSTTGLSDDIYIAFILSALVELPAYFLVIVLMDHWGRKPTLALVLFIGGAFCIPAGFTEGGLQTALVLMGKTFIVISDIEKSSNRNTYGGLFGNINAY